MEFRILGPLEVADNGEPLHVGARKIRMLLALLVINANRVVTTDRILEELWGDDAEGKEKALWVYISRLRAALGDEEVIVTRDHGYALVVEEDDLDVHQFESATIAGRALVKQDPSAASRVLREGLALWRGPALEEFAYEEFAQSAIVRLEELRLAALEDRIDADLRLGLAGELVGELEVLRQAHPTRERVVSQLMLALYRAGRQSDALRAYEAFRRYLGEELGLEPSPELRLLDEQILLHDSRIQARRPAGDRPLSAGTLRSANPFKGLRAFHEDDTADFFGRDRLVADIVRRLDAGRTLIGLVGPSGSGKSSVVRAGLIPALRKGAIEGSDDWLIAQMVPGAHPFAELEAALLRSSLDAPDSLSDQLSDPDAGVLRAVLRVLPKESARLVLVIDQFEELFTLVDDETRRVAFLTGLLTAAQDPHGRVKVIFTLRADFYDRPLAYPDFGAEMGEGIVNVVPLSPDELEAAARRPAEEAGVTLEPALVVSLLADVLEQPGGLPLFQYALTELFDRRVDHTLTIATYESMDGVRGALSRRADALYEDLDPEQRAAARQLFLRLVIIADGDEWGRRRVPASEILSLDLDVLALQTVIDAFAGQRLLTLDRDAVTGSPTVEVAHEALLTNWDRLRDWIEDSREDLKRHEALTAALNEWNDAGRDADYLLTGARLAAYEQWAASTTMRLTEAEHTFIDESSSRRSRAEDERRSREATAKRASRRRLWGAVALTVMSVVTIALTLGVFGPSAGPTVSFFGDPGDGSWNANIVAGLDRAEREFGLVRENVRPTVNPPEEFRAMAANGADLIVTDSAPTYQAPGVFSDYPEIKFAVIDGVVDSPNTASILFANEQGAFLAGSAAALKSETGIVGFVGGDRIEPIEEFRAGFEAGARFVDPEIEILATYVEERPDDGMGADAFANEDLGEQRATALYERGADVVFHAAGFSGFGVFAAAVRQSQVLDRHLWAIGVDNDQWFQVNADERAHVLTSILKRGDVAAYLATKQFIEGDFTPGVQELDLADGALDFSTQGDGLTPAMIEQLQAIRSDIAEGRISVPTVPTGQLLVVDRGDLGAYTAFETGTYTLEVLGTPITFTVTGSWSTQPVSPGFFAITTPDSRSPGDHDIVFVRPTELFDPVAGTPTLAVDDLERWLADVSDTISISEPVQTTVAGLDALTFDAVVNDEATCLLEEKFNCVGFLMVGPTPGYFNRGFLYNLVWIDHADGPIVIVSGTTEDDPDWLGEARDVIDTLKIG
ncbi:MAG TPA: BTAD domain-containing putative transcriptional regulator [Acidimicrobiia bacterium]|nr:BTAD domain-containing putative transcriptional regulator [Acidimicrobiia bacterium]